MAAQDAELKLKVSLDLGFFRQQLAGLGQAAAGYSIPVQVKFDRRSVQNELNALSSNIRRREYRLNIQTNLKEEIENARKLATALAQVSSGSGIGSGVKRQAGTFRQELGQLDTESLKKVYAAAAKASLLAFDQETNKNKGKIVTALNQAAQDASQGFLNALSKENSKVRQAAGEYGDALLSGLKRTLKIQSPSKEMFDIGDDAGKGFELGLLKSLEIAEQSAGRQMRRMLDRLARMALMMTGMSAAEISKQALGAARPRGLPGVDFPATVPSRAPSIGPSSTGRLLPGAAAAQQLPGTKFGAAGFLPGRPSQSSILEFNNILAGAIREYFNAVAKEIVKPAKVSIATQPLLGAGSKIAGLLPAAGGTTPASQMRFNAVSTGASLGQQQFMRAPSIPPPAGGGGGGAVPPSGGGGGAGGMGGFGRAMGGINLPGAGVVRELGNEFAFATKQVLLFGQAYKMLAFIQNFPAQVGDAVSQLQNFRNTLGAISPTAQEAAASNQLILDLVDKYNVPLQSARDGFTKLYASMAPAGFSGDEVRDLFTGITQAAATFGMSADKVDRVNYAFAQMASKGQVMSEELKGQLGDVLPGAMALFAEAAGFEGPKAIQDFSAALEDGAYKGQAMVALLKNVGVIMQQEFGPGAEGAARTFQGVINRMQNSMALLYESFEPVAVGFLNGVVVPLTAGIKQISDGFNSFFTGAAAQTAGGFAIAQELERLAPAFEGIRQNIGGVIEQFGQFARIALEVSKVLLQIAGNPIVGYLLKLYAIALPINIALNVMRGLWAANVLQLVIFNTRVATGTSTLSAFRGMMAATGSTAQATAASIRTAGITLRTFFATTGVGLVIVGVSMLIEKFLSMNQALADTKAKALGAAQAIRMMSQTEARAAEQEAQSTFQLIGQMAGRQGVKQQGGDRLIPVSQKELAQLQKLGAIQSQQAPGGPAYVKRSEAMALGPQAQRLQAEAAYQQRRLKFEDQQTNVALTPIPPSEQEGKPKKGEKLDTYDRSQLDFIQQQFEIEKQRLDKQLQAQLISQTQYDISLAELKFETEKLEIAEKYRLAVEKTNKDNLSAADKSLKLKDLEVLKTNALAIAEDDRNIAIGAARQKITEPIIDEIDREMLAVDEQILQMEALKEGRLDLSEAQQAELAIKEKFMKLSADEKKLAEGEIEILRQQIQLRLENAKAIEKQKALTKAEIGLGTIGGGLKAGFTGSAAGVFEQAMEQYGDKDYAAQLANVETAAMQLRSVFDGLQGAISGVSSAFANMLTEGVTNMITGTASAKEVFATFLQSVGQALSQAASQMIATYIAIGIAKLFAGLGGGGGNPAGSGGGISDSLPGMRQYAGGMGGGGAPGSMPFAPPAFANGGIVTGPTLSLIGEGKYNEAVVPLPNGKSIPVQLSGQRSAREMMSRNSQATSQASPINLSFETTKIGNTEYVSRDQLEAAMAETRRAAINGGAARGMSMTLDRIQQSPSTRSRIGIR